MNSTSPKKPKSLSKLRTSFKAFHKAKTFLNKVIKGVSLFNIIFADEHISDGPENDFPQYLLQITYRSPTMTAAVSRIKDFIIGTSVHPDLKDVVVDSEGTTFQQFHEKVANDFAWIRRLAIKVKPRRNMEIAELRHIPAEWVRWGIPDDKTYNVDYCMVDPLNFSGWERMQCEKLPLWEKDKKKNVTSVASEGDKYNGHIFFFNLTSERHRYYSRPEYFSAENYINTDYKAGLFYDRYTDNNFFGGGILNIVGSPDAGIEIVDSDGELVRYTTAGEEMDKALQSYTGAENGGTILSQWINNKEEATTFVPFVTSSSHEIFESISSISTEKICIATGVPKVLLPLATAGKLGDSQEIRNAIGFLNERTEKYRQILEGIYRDLLTQMNLKNVKIPDERLIVPIMDYTDLSDTIFNSLKSDQKEEYLQKQFNIEPSEIKEEEIEEVEENEQFEEEIQNLLINSNGDHN